MVFYYNITSLAEGGSFLFLRSGTFALNSQAKAWLTKASRYRSSVWKVGDKRPGKIVYRFMITLLVLITFFFCGYSIEEEDKVFKDPFVLFKEILFLPNLIIIASDVLIPTISLFRL